MRQPLSSSSFLRQSEPRKDVVISSLSPVCHSLPDSSRLVTIEACPEMDLRPSSGPATDLPGPVAHPVPILLQALGHPPEQGAHLQALAQQPLVRPCPSSNGLREAKDEQGATALSVSVDWTIALNNHDVKPPYHYGQNADLDLFLECNQVDFPEGTPMSEMHPRLTAAFGDQNADLVEEGLRLAFARAVPFAPLPLHDQR